MIELEDFEGKTHKVKYITKVRNQSRHVSYWIILIALLLFWPLALWFMLTPRKGYIVKDENSNVLHIPDYEYERWRDYKLHFLNKEEV